MEAYKGGDTFELSDSSAMVPEQQHRSIPPPSSALPPLEVADETPSVLQAGELARPPREHTITRSTGVEAFSLAKDEDGPRLATLDEMRAFIDNVRSLRGRTPTHEELLAAFSQGLDIYNRTERTRFAHGLESPVARVEVLYAVAERATSSLVAALEAASIIFLRPGLELARSFFIHVTALLENGHVQLSDRYIASSISPMLEEAMYGLILDASHLTSTDLHRLKGGASGSLESKQEAQPARKLSPEEKRARMGLGVKRAGPPNGSPDQPPENPDNPLSESAVPLGDPSVSDDPWKEYEREVETDERAQFAAMIERVKVGAGNKFARYGRVKPPPSISPSDKDGALLQAYAAMRGEDPRFSDTAQAHVYGVAEALATWCAAEIEVLSKLKAPPEKAAFDATISKARRDKIGSRLQVLQEAERRNCAAIRAKLAEVATLIIADQTLASHAAAKWPRDLAVFGGVGMGQIIQNSESIAGGSWREANIARERRERQMRADQEKLRRDPDSLPGSSL